MPKNNHAGIIAIETYFPKNYVSLQDLELYYAASKGKYTIGLGQTKLAFTNDREDVVSLALTVLHRLMSAYNLNYQDVGRLEVATETIQDHSKSIKTFLMDLFEKSGNYNVEGVDSMNACYAATNALFNSVAWVESSDWNGKMALVVSVDIAEYSKGPARPTGGVGAVAFAVGPGAPLRLEPQCRFSHMRNVFDFYKPHLGSPYPVVFGHFSNSCYMDSLSRCYKGYLERFRSTHNQRISVLRGGIDYFVFHAPYNKLVQKAFAWIVFNEFLLDRDNPFFAEKQRYLSGFTLADHADRELMKELLALSRPLYSSLVLPSTEFPAQIGNGYTASAYLGLASLLANKEANQVKSKRIAVFSYGSGSAATLFSFKVGGKFEDLQPIVDCLERAKRGLEARVSRTAEEFERAMDRKELIYGLKSYRPESSLDAIFDDVFYFEGKDVDGKKSYGYKSKS